MTPKPDQKIALITGSTSGLGREVAFRLSALDYFIIVHGRNRERGLEVVAQIEESGIGGARFYAADLGSLQQVRQLGEDLVKDFDRLDVLVNNAGIGSSPARRLVSEDGHELRFQVNYLSHFLLTHQLLPLLQDSAPSRIVNVSSGAQQAIDFDDVMLESGFSGGRAYAQSKLAQILFTVDLAENLQGSDVLVNALHPATYMDTAMVRNAGATPRTTVGEGADGVMQLITEDVGSGNYFVRQRSVRANRQAYDEDARTRLWQLSEQLTGLE
ncbi:MAG TPA: 3-oxoacyl-ACP reductase [Gammaproteobacteria bacterium]|nr:SDR family NAD(P)-dependent oxidoreductase [Gammaproteobacteria bacterium]MDP6732776.1 SDR family NAD(P)-dependent oxidoreductase [Gammaproteobacteria bacterium]HAJ75773.1 3-oxoacyl-ACP reductase [Gammaproteobacteria bacterium]